MATTPNKTQATSKSVAAFVQSITNKEQRDDAQVLLKLFEEVSKEKPVMWGDSIVGYGSYHYTYASGREGDAPIIGFSPRAANLTIYIVPGFDAYGELLKKLGKFKTSVSCLYIKKLEDIHLPTLKKLAAASVRDVKSLYKH